MALLERYLKETPSIVAAEEDDAEYWTLSRSKQAYTDYLMTKRDEIDEQQNARRYRHGAHWTAEQVRKLNLRKQPVVTYNRIGRKIDSIVGLMERLRQDPKAFPRNPTTTDEASAELATACVRYVVESQLKEHLFPFAVDMAATDGIGGVELLLEEDENGEQDISFALVDTDNFFYDIHSIRHDFADARYMGQGKWLDIEQIMELVPEKAKEIKGSFGGIGMNGDDLTTNPDRERRWIQGDGIYRKIRVVDLWYRHRGGWCWCLFTGSMKLDEGKSYFFNDKGKPICKYFMFSGFIDHDGDRYGFVRNLRSSQDEINQRRSKGLHELNARRIKAQHGAFDDVEQTRHESVRPDGVVLYNPGFEMEFDDATRLANVEGHLKFLEDAKNEIENFGPNPALIGQGLEYKSGRAINLLQQAGIAELGPFVLGVKNWKLRLYRAIWAAAKQYWKNERWIRVTDAEGIGQLVQVNGVGIDQQTGIPHLINYLGDLDVNFVLEEGPDEVNMMADGYDTLIALTAQGANIPPPVLIELSPLHASVKRKLMAMVEKPDPAQEAAKLVAIKGEQAKITETESKARLNDAKAEQARQGGAHGIIERQMDAQREERQFALKQAETASKVRGKMAETKAKLMGEVMKTRLGAVQGRQKMIQSDQQHRQKLAQNAQNAALRVQQQRQNGGNRQ